MSVKLPNRLFLKLMLAFWLTSILVLAFVIGLPRLLPEIDIQPLQPKQQQLLQRAAKRIAELPKHSRGRALRQQNADGGMLRFFVLDQYGRPLRRGEPRPTRELRRFIAELDDLDQPMGFRFRNQLVFGPEPLLINGQKHFLIGQIQAPKDKVWLFLLHSHPFAFLLVALAISSTIFGLLAWHLGKPLRSIQATAERLSQGELDARVEPITLARSDEFGQLGRGFNRMADSISGLIASQQQLVSDVSHELRTPLTRLQLALALARKKRNESPELDRINQEAELLEQMIQQLLTLSQLSSQGNQTKKPLDLILILESVFSSAEFEAEQRGKHIELTHPETLEIKGIESLLQRAIENLLRNAIQYSTKNVKLTIAESVNAINISIVDDGAGVPEQQLAEIFKPFYRVDSARTRESGGWGLGLAIVKASIDAHHGQISAKQAGPTGLEINISLPKIETGTV